MITATCKRCRRPFTYFRHTKGGRPRTVCDDCKSPHELIDGPEWRRLRAEVLAEEPNCYICGAQASQVDHVEPLVRRPDLGMDRSNLRAACSRCNLIKSRSEAALSALEKRRTGERVDVRPTGLDPCTCPPGCRCEERGSHSRHWCL